MANNKTSILIDELGQAIRTIDGTGDYVADFSDASKMFYAMDRPDFERVQDAGFPRVLILVKDLQREEILNQYNIVVMQLNIIIQFKQADKYNADLASGQELLDYTYDVIRGIRAWQDGTIAPVPVYTVNAEITSETTQEIGRNDRLITIETIFSCEFEESF